MFGLTFEKALLIFALAAFLIGPAKLPLYAEKLGALIRQLKQLANGTKQRLRDEVGDEFDDIDWKKLDPRQYDPRQIIRQALSDEPAPAPKLGRAERFAQAAREEEAERAALIDKAELSVPLDRDSSALDAPSPAPAPRPMG